MKNLKSSVSNMGICNAQQQKDIVKRNNNGMPNIERMMPAASDKGSQPYRNAFRCFEMAGMRYNKNNSLPLGRRHGLFGYVPYLKARFYLWASLSPAISRCLKARLYGWLPLSNAYGIFSIAPQHIK